MYKGNFNERKQETHFKEKDSTYFPLNRKTCNASTIYRTHSFKKMYLYKRRSISNIGKLLSEAGEN